MQYLLQTERTAKVSLAETSEVAIFASRSIRQNRRLDRTAERRRRVEPNFEPYADGIQPYAGIELAPNLRTGLRAPSDGLAQSGAIPEKSAALLGLGNPSRGP